MDLFALTRALIDIESVTGHEAAVGDYLAAELRRLGLEVELWPVTEPDQPPEQRRNNVWARRGRPDVVLSTHMDTVPPFVPSRETADRIHGRGACDAKGIIAAQIAAAASLLEAGEENLGLLFLVGEEKNSAGARAANQHPAGGRFLVNGEPTSSHMVSAGKGALRVNLVARGVAAHSAYPELGDSAVDKLLAALAKLRALALPSDPILGPTTCNIGTLAGGRAPNVIADFARAELLYRLVAPAAELRAAIAGAVAGLAEAEFALEIPPVRLLTLPGYPTRAVAFTTDIPSLSAWGRPLLFGPGPIEAAHTADEYIDKAELAAAVVAYADIFRKLRATPA